MSNERDGVRKHCVTIIALVTLVATHTTWALPIDYEWAGGDGSWFTPENWMPVGVPTAVDSVVHDSFGIARIEDGNAAAMSLRVGYQSPGSHELYLDNNGHLAATTAILGGIDADGYLVLLNRPTAPTVSLQTLTIGDGGVGSLEIYSGTLDCTNATVGSISTGYATLDSSRSHWNVSSALNIGQNDSGQVTLTNGATLNCTGGNCVVGANRSGLLQLDQSSGTCAGATTIGDNGAGTLRVTGANASWMTNSLTTGIQDFSNVEILSGGVVNVTQGVDIGVSDFQHTAFLNISGAGSQLTGSQFRFAEDGDCDASIADGGTAVTAGSASVGGSSGYGRLYLYGTETRRGVLQTRDLYEGFGLGNVTFDGGILRAAANNFDILHDFELNEVQIAAGGAFVDTNGFAASISSPLAGTGRLTKQGAGSLSLQAVNTFAGGLGVDAGTLSRTVSGAFPDLSNCQINGGTFNLSNFDFRMSSLLGTGGAVDIGARRLDIIQSQNTTWSGAFSGTGIFVKAGTGRLDLANNMIFSGQSYVNGGTLGIFGNVDVSGVHVGDTTGNGTLTVTGPLASLQCSTFLTVGDNGAGSGPGGIGTLNISNGGAVALNTFAKLTVGWVNADGTVNLNATGRLDVGGVDGIQKHATGTAHFNLAGGTIRSTSNLTTAVNMALSGTTSTIDTLGNSATFSGALTGTGALTKSGAGMLTLSNPSTNYSGTTTVSEGTLRITNNSNFASAVSINPAAVLLLDIANDVRMDGSISGSGQINVTGTITTARLAGNDAGFTGTFSLPSTARGMMWSSYAAGSAAASWDLSGNFGVIETGAGDGTVYLGALQGTNSATQIAAFGGSGTKTLEVGGLGTTTMFAGTIRNTASIGGGGTGQVALTKVGAGELVLGSANTYHGGTTVNAGMLTQQVANAFPPFTDFVVNGGTLNMNNLPLTMTALSGTGGMISIGTAMLTVDQSAMTSYAGSISGSSGSLRKQGMGTLTLSGNSNYTGGTIVATGTLVVNGSLPGGMVVASGATLTGSGSVNGTTQIQGGGVLSPGSSPGPFTVGGTLTVAGTLQIDITGEAPGSQHDQVVVTNGDVTISAGAELAFGMLSGSFGANSRLFIVSNTGSGTLTVEFNGLPDGGAVGTVVPALGGLGGHGEWRIYYHADTAMNALTGGNDIALAPSTPVGCACPGDMNHDGILDGADILSFTTCVISSGSCDCADVDGVIGVNTADVPVFVDLLVTGATCPEDL